MIRGKKSIINSDQKSREYDIISKSKSQGKTKASNRRQDANIPKRNSRVYQKFSGKRPRESIAMYEDTTTLEVQHIHIN